MEYTVLRHRANSQNLWHAHFILAVDRVTYLGGGFPIIMECLWNQGAEGFMRKMGKETAFL